MLKMYMNQNLIRADEASQLEPVRSQLACTFDTIIQTQQKPSSNSHLQTSIRSTNDFASHRSSVWDFTLKCFDFLRKWKYNSAQWRELFPSAINFFIHHVVLIIFSENKTFYREHIASKLRGWMCGGGEESMFICTTLNHQAFQWKAFSRGADDEKAASSIK